MRFDSRRGYGFVAPDEGGEDVFVHQKQINMEGFRYLQVGEKVGYELEVSERGMKAMSVSLLEPRVERGPRDAQGGDHHDHQDHHQDHQQDQRDERPRAPREHRDHGDDLMQQVEKMRRKQERLISLLVEKGVLAPGEIDGVESASGAG